MHALIVDDSTLMRKVIERALRQADLDVTTATEASNGQEALDLLWIAPPPDIILCDINMPGMDGIAFLEARMAQKLALDVPAVMISSKTNEQIVRRAILAGARGFLCKPFTPEQVRARLQPLLAAG